MNGTSYYRLKQVDFDGSFSYSDIRSVVLESDHKFVIFPNPSTDESDINLLTNGEKRLLSIEIHDLSGRLIWNNKRFVVQSKTTPLSVRMYAGVYLISIQDANENKTVQKIIVK